jgi:superfamily II DNA or RNA helicase
MASITTDMIRQAYSSVTFDKGRAYLRDGSAQVTRISPDGTVVEGDVLGSLHRAYRSTARLRRLANGAVRVESWCSCPLGGDCKHVVALLLQAAENRGETVTSASPRPAVAAVLSPGVADWLTQMERAGRAASDDYPPEIRRRLIYVLSLVVGWDEVPRPRLVAMSAPLLKDGSFSPTAQPYAPANVLNAKPAQFLRPSDFIILRRMAQGTTNVGGQQTLDGETGAEVLGLILKTGRCHWGSLSGPALALGEARTGTIRWSSLADGRQHPVVSVEGGGVAIPLAPPWYVDGEARICGPVETGLAPRLAGLLLAAPPVEIAEIAAVRTRLSASLPESQAHLPPEMEPPQTIKVKPVPRLLLHHRRLQRATYSYSQVTSLDMPLARLSFFYGDHEVASDNSRDRPVVVKGSAVFEIERSRPQERKAGERLKGLGFGPLSHLYRWNTPTDCRSDFVLGEDFDEDAWIGFLTEEVPDLIAGGWRVEVADGFPVRVATADGDIEAELDSGSGIDWFELHLGVPVDGVRVNILPALLKLLRQIPGDQIDDFFEEDDEDDEDGRLLRLRLEDGRILSLPFARLRPILQALTGLFAAGGGDSDNVRLGRADAVDAATFADAVPGLVWRGGEHLRELGRQLKDHAGIPAVALPDLFTGSLRPYQQAGLNWMQLLRSVGLGGVLADDMGLGKTVQTLAHIAVEKAAGRLDRPCLVIAPTSLMANWSAEAATFTPALSVLVLHGAARKDSFATIASHDIVLTTYPLLTRDADVLTAQDWHMVILDEAQFVKNPATTAAKALRGFNARHRLALSGTPLENHLGELWSLFDFVSPGFLGDRTAFTRNWRTPIERKGDDERRATLARRVKPFLLRRTKGQVAADLPPKTEIIEHIELTAAQRDLYEGIRLAMHKKVREAIAAKGLRRSRIELLDALLKLRQACCDPRLVKTRVTSKAGSAKLTRLMEMVTELVEDGRRILLFSQFTSMLALIETELQKAKIPYLLLTGDTKDRATPVRRFQNGEVPLFLISLRAGGTGLNLTAADTVIHYDPWWNPAVEAQATDRAHRIGQDKPVFVHKLVALDTIEVKMAELKSRKQALADGLFDPEAGSALDIGEDDIEFLLGG